MSVSETRKAVARLLKRYGAKARRGHQRIEVGDLFWYVDLRAEAPGPRAPMRLEVGCWPTALPPEPDGGAVDCPLLFDVILGGDPIAEITHWLELVAAIGDVATLAQRLPELPDALVDIPLRALFDR